jgi:eukaryotic-like serine/threonine-protein kinase
VRSDAITRDEHHVDTEELLAASFDALGVENPQPLTQGGQKWVFGAELAGADVVVKIVKLPTGPSAGVVLERAHREVELLAAVDSPYVVRVLSDAIEISDPPEAVAWVEERLGGNDLSGSLGPPSWGEDRVFELLNDVASALQACHDLAVVHRDLSPSNVRLLPSGRFVLMDPGYAKHLRLAALTGVFQPGTPGFRSPEHVPGGDPSAASDVFCLGILAFYAMTGTFPIDPNVPDAEYNRLLRNTQAPSIAVLVPTVSSDLARIIDTCLQRQPARRYLDGKELLDALAQIGRSR